MITSFFASKSSSKRKNNGSTTRENNVRDTNINQRQERNNNSNEGTTTTTLQQKRQKRESPSFGIQTPRLDPKSTTTTTTELSNDVQELLAHFPDIPHQERTWRNMLNRHLESPGFARLAKFVAAERTKNTIYPPVHDTFSALNLTPLHQVKVVIVGQDPYHGPNQGHGLCFSVKKGVPIPPSLRNMYKELSNDPKVNFTVPNHGFLMKWSQQGVLLLNSVLTVQKGNANSHKNKGWEQFTDQVIRILHGESKTNDRGMVFLLWGKPASTKAESIVRHKGKNVVICTSHPSPLGATKTKSPFLGSRCFSKANEALIKMGQDPIDWNVD